MSAGALTDLLAAEAARFTLAAAPDEQAPAGVVEPESLRTGKPLGVGIYVKHLATGEEAAVRPDLVFESQSVIKLAILIRAYQLADAGTLELDERVRVEKDDLSGGSGILQYHQPGLEPTVRDLLTEMIFMSDNSATDLVLARIGGTAELNAWLAAAGYAEARLACTSREISLFPYEVADAGYRSLSGAQVYALRSDDPAWAGLTRDWLDGIQAQADALAARPLAEVRALARARGLSLYYGQITPREAGRMLESIERAPGESGAEMRLALRRQWMGGRRLERGTEYPVGHKTGDGWPWDCNDVGIVYAPSGPIVVAVFANDLGGDYAAEEERIGDIARVVVDYFEA